MLASDLRSEARWLSSGFILMFFSGFGQTFFIAIFAGELKSTLALSDGQFGSIFAAATLASAALLMWAGRLADTLAIRWLATGVLAGLALTALAMACVPSAWLLGPILFGLRFFGQGMTTHVAMTAMGRWFNRKRGRAVSIAGLGFPASEAVLPIIAVSITAMFGWRITWAAAAGLTVLVAIPVMSALLSRDRVPTTGGPGTHTPEPVRREWTRGEVLTSPLFYALMPGILSSPFIVTGIFFNQVTIVGIKGWQLSWFAASFPILAAASVVSALVSGFLVDRFGARRLLPLMLVPLGLATLMMALSTNPAVLPVFMAVVGTVMGMNSTVQGALWAELYGTEHLGAIRALAMAGIVFASALSPGLIGILMDAGIGLEGQLVVMGAYCFLAAVWMLALVPRLNRLALA